MAISIPYHKGELAVQQKVGETEMARINSGAIDETILAGALRFIEQQPMVVIGSMDSQGRVWVSTLFGNPGFFRALDNHTLELDLSQPHSAEDEPLWANLIDNPNVGLLIIELGSRRRIRINGRVRTITTERIIIDVERAYPNCPKYIQRRDWKTLDDEAQNEAKPSTHGKELNETQKTLIANADTIFVASAHPDHGVDASHRGGHPGFVHILNNKQLRIPDYAGNSMFNTLGNFVSYPHAGLIFIDFERGRLLQLTGRPEILWEQDDPQGETGGTRRYWLFEITAWQESTLPYRFAWEYLDASPHIPELHHESSANNILSLRVEQIQSETDRVKSFRFRAVDGRQLPQFHPGAHLQIKVKLRPQLSDGSDMYRHYSLLSDPNDRSLYEIGVLKEPEGRGGSLYMHEQVNEGDTISVQAPKNEFPMAASADHSILIAGGIGITPILSMLHKLAADKKSFEMHYSARELTGLAFRNRVEQLAGEHAHFYASQDPQGQHLDLKHLLSTPKPGVHVYICGPRGMINAVREITADQGWPSAHVHFESFGAQPLADDQPIRVHLAKSKKTIIVPANRTILDSLLDAGVSVPHDCKRGECTMCTTRVLNGEPDHRDLCLNSEGKASSMCVCVSRAKSKDLTLCL